MGAVVIAGCGAESEDGRDGSGGEVNSACWGPEDACECNPDDLCPDAPPEAGATCEGACLHHACDYDVGGCSEEYTCTDAGWERSSSCQSCIGLDAEECSANTFCRLVRADCFDLTASFCSPEYACVDDADCPAGSGCEEHTSLAEMAEDCDPFFQQPTIVKLCTPL